MLLAGRRVLVTRAAHQAGKLADGLRALGAEPVEVPVLEIRPPASYETLDGALHRLPAYDWLVLTSANAVRALAERAAALGIRLTDEGGPRVAAIGAGTSAAAEHVGFQITIVPVSYVAESLIDVFPRELIGVRVLLARAAVARDVIPDALRAAGAHVDVVDAYSNALPATAPELLRRALERGVDVATFTSSSSVLHLAEAARRAGIPIPFSGVGAISIGPITSQTLRDQGWPPAAEATQSDVAGLIAAVVHALDQGGKLA